MPANSFLRSLTSWRFRLFILLLQIPVMPLSAADKRLGADNMSAVVAHSNLTQLGQLPGNNQMRLTLGLPLRDAAELTNLLADIYNPASPQYHHYLTSKEFAARFGPTPADYAAVMHFANTNGLTVMATHPSRLLVDVSGRVADVERALHVKLYSFRHPTESRNFFAPDTEPTVDARLPLFHISGLDNFSQPHPNVLIRPATSLHKVFPNAGSSPFGTYMGNDFRQAYVPGTALTGAGQNVGLLQFDAFDPDDIATYANTIGLTNNVPQVVVMPVNGGGGVPGGGQGEVTLDIEMVMSMSPGVSNIYVYEAPNTSTWASILSQMADDDLAAQLSCSWSGGGEDPVSEQIFLQMAAQGQTFFCASGDSGAYNGVPPFPCASPSITQVGGTYLATDTNGNYYGEVAWNRNDGYCSGGGIGPGVAIPIWQLGLDMTTNGGSTVCRNVPDVALTADDIYLFVNGQGWTAGGTSCAAPLWAGLTALINQQAAQLSQPSVGFLNPAIYALCRGTNYATTFHDITVGNNTNTLSSTNFFAAPGYDLCTGWGTPTGINLINALTTLDCLGILPSATLSANGLVGGPFSQTNWTITLANSGTNNLDWSLGGVPTWLTVSADNGTLDANGSTNICLQVVNPYGMPAYGYYAVLSVTNLTLSTVHNVTVEMDVGQNIVQNGGFETGDFTGWTLVGDTIVGETTFNVVATDGDFPGLAHSGYFGALLGQAGYAATLSQTLTTTPGQQYLVSCWLNNPKSGSAQTFSAYWGGTNFVNLTNPPAFTWTNFQLIATATDTNTVLMFAAENDPNYFGFDDVSVQPIPPVAFSGYSSCTNGFQLTWPSLAGLNYMIQYSTNLSQGWCQNLCTNTALTNVTTYLDANVMGTWEQGFYRLVLVP